MSRETATVGLNNTPAIRGIRHRGSPPRAKRDFELVIDGS